MQYDSIIIGAGLSGLTAASLLAKRGLKVAVIDTNYQPGGTCGIFKRGNATFDQGSAMLYGFGEDGFNAHRFVFNCLEEPIDMIRHDLLYQVRFKDKTIKFYPDIKKFTQEIALLFPSQQAAIERFYRDMLKIYRDVLIEHPIYSSADEIHWQDALHILFRHPISFARFLGYINKNAKSLLQKYFDEPEIFKFFDKLTSTYSYTTVEESPAVLAAIMFVDNHVGGSYYPAGSTLFLPGKLEKVIEEHGGDMLLEKEVTSILFKNKKPVGVRLNDGSEHHARAIIYSGTVWNLYGKLIAPENSTEKRRNWAARQVPSYPSVVLYAVVSREAIPPDSCPIELLVGNPDHLDESEVTVYIFSLDDRSLCAEDEHTVIAIGPTFEAWEGLDPEAYKRLKNKERERLLDVLESRYPAIKKAVRHSELASPKTIERYTLKNGGAVAGPKQMLGQHMSKRLHIRTEWPNLFCCGESTYMGTGTPTVTSSGLTAANAVLSKFGKKTYRYQPKMQNFVRFVSKPFIPDRLYQDSSPEDRSIQQEAARCRYCEHPTCNKNSGADIRGIMRRLAVGNFSGAKKRWVESAVPQEQLGDYEGRCIRSLQKEEPVQIRRIITYISGNS